MKVSLITATTTILLTATIAESASALDRVLHWGGGAHHKGQGGRLAKLQQMVDLRCNSDFACPVTITGCDAEIEKPERPGAWDSWWDMSEEERADKKAEVEAFRQQILTCACCDGKTVQELVGRDRESRLEKIQEKVDSKCNSDFTCPDTITGCDSEIDKPDKPGAFEWWWDMSEEEKDMAKAEMEAFKQQLLVCTCCDGKTIQELMGRESDFDGDDSDESTSLDEGRFDSSSTSEDSDTEDEFEDFELSSSLPEQAVSIAKASAAVDGLDIGNSNPAAGQASISWVLVLATFGIVGLAL